MCEACPEMVNHNKQELVVLSVIDGEEGFMPTYAAQLAMIHEYDSMEDAATSNVGTHPEAKERGKPYRVVVVPRKHWREFQVYSESVEGRDRFKAYPNTEDRTIEARSDFDNDGRRIS